MEGKSLPAGPEYAELRTAGLWPADSLEAGDSLGLKRTIKANTRSDSFWRQGGTSVDQGGSDGKRDARLGAPPAHSLGESRLSDVVLFRKNDEIIMKK